MINEALSLYNLEGMDAQFIRHNENITYRIGEGYLLRIHKSVEGFSTELFYSDCDKIILRESELEFLIHLCENGLYVQSPIRNKKGELVSILSDGTPVTVLTWIEGRIVDKKELSVSLCRDMGAMVTKLHKATQGFLPKGAARYDSSLCGRLIDKIDSLFEDGRLSKENHKDMSGALGVIRDLLNGSERELIPVHSDLSESNILITPSGLVPIDFSLFGYGHPMLDIASFICLTDNTELQGAVIDGYKSAGGNDVDYHALDCCFALQVLLGVIIHFERWENEEWFSGKLNRWCGDIFSPLSEGKCVVDEIVI
ncbi:MAG: phosphotransferase enzyme family protein [Eubacteriales bacterium]